MGLTTPNWQKNVIFIKVVHLDYGILLVFTAYNAIKWYNKLSEQIYCVKLILVVQKIYCSSNDSRI